MTYSVGEITFEFADSISILQRIIVNKSIGVDNIHLIILFQLSNMFAVPLKIILEHSYTGFPLTRTVRESHGINFGQGMSWKVKEFLIR